MGDIPRERTEGKWLNSMKLRQYKLCCVNQNVEFAKAKSALHKEWRRGLIHRAGYKDKAGNESSWWQHERISR
jgi:hypothetical protein